jgi:FSR family fosmidomycin resistance protein-like MFS transporter
MDRLGLSIALAALLTTTLAISSSLLQPLMGFLSDRWGRRGFVILGPVVSGVFLSLIGAAPSLTVLIVILAVGGLGSAVFHPPGASMAVRVEAGGSRGLRYSLFSFGGSAGFAVGPLVAVMWVTSFGLERLWLAMIPVLLLAPVLLVLLPSTPAASAAAAPPSPSELVRLFAGPLGLVFGISVACTFVQRVFLTMEPIAADAAGAPEAVGALALSAFLAGQAGGSLLGGWLTDRMPRGRLLALLTVSALPAYVAALAARPGSATSLVAAVLAGCTSMAVLPPVVVTAQEQMPAGAAVGSGIAMGLAWAVGSAGVLLTGVLGDAIGARSAALASTPVILVATLLAMHPALRREAGR